MELLVIGLDGLSYNMLERFDVDFPYLDRVREEGVSGDLMSVDTPTTVPAWTSFATGLDPGTHGVYGMNQVTPSYEKKSPDVNTTDPAIYDFLDDSIFINLPATQGRVPAGEDTYLSSSILAADKEEMTPEPLKELDSFDQYVPVDDVALKLDIDGYRDRLEEIVRSRERFADEAFETYDPRVGFVLFSTTDWAGHLLSKLSADADHQYYYRSLAEAVADATETLAGHADNVVLMSDHGFERKHRTVHLSDFLHDRGHLVERQSGTEDTGLGDRLADGAANVAVDAAKLVSRRSERLYGLFRFAYNRLLGSAVGGRLQEAAQPDADYANSEVFNLRYGCLFVNDERFDNPQVTGDDVAALRTELAAELADLTTDDGDPIFREVLTPEEAYADPGEGMPDVIPRPAPGHFPINHWSPTGGYTSPTTSYEHRYRGIFAAHGPLFGSGGVEDMSIVDVLPTVLAALGDPLSPAFDGTARTDLLAGDVAPTTRSAGDLPAPRTREESAREREEREAVVEERLSDLGYME